MNAPTLSVIPVFATPLALIDLPIEIDPAHFLAYEWLKAVRPGEWQVLHG